MSLLTKVVYQFCSDQAAAANDYDFDIICHMLLRISVKFLRTLLCQNVCRRRYESPDTMSKDVTEALPAAGSTCPYPGNHKRDQGQHAGEFLNGSNRHPTAISDNLLVEASKMLWMASSNRASYSASDCSTVRPSASAREKLAMTP